MKPAGTKLADYIRVSSDKQDTKRQRDAIDGWAGRHGLPIIAHFEDSEGRNPRDQAAKRAQFQALLKAVERGEVDCIIVDSQDRFGTKDAHEWGKFISFLRDHDCELWSVAQGLLSANDDATVLTTTIGALTSTREQKEKATRNLGGKIVQAKQGIYQGGYPPFGFDVVCFGADGREKWRVEYVGGGHHRREKVYPDGTREPFNGKGNFPAKDPSDVLRYRPTINAERLATARKIFEWYASEDVSPQVIAVRLAKLEVTPHAGETWYGVKIRKMLEHPIYIGYPTYNKRAGSRFREYVNGQIQDVPSKGGKVKLGRKRAASDFVQPPAPEFPPVVPVEIWRKVQAKLKATSFAATGRKHRPAHTDVLAKLWLRPYLYCGRCGRPMRGNSPLGGANGDKTRGLTYPSYTCGTYGTYGKENPAGCRCHRVKAELLDKIVEKYLDETCPHFRELSESLDDPTLFNAAFVRLAQSLSRRNKLAAEMIDATGCNWNPFDLAGSYGPAYMQRLPEIDRAIAAKEETLEEMLEGFRTLSPRLRERANRRMESLQEEIDALQRQREDLRMPWEAICTETNQRAEAFELAAGAADNGDGWRNPELLRGIIDKIVCHFRYTRKNGESYMMKSFLDSVEIYPAGGSPVSLPSETQPGRGLRQLDLAAE